MHQVYLLLGSNKGNRRKYLLMAMYLLQNKIGTIVRTSSVYITEPWGNNNQPKYLNQALIINTQCTPLQLLKKLQKIEKELGRTNKNQYSSRTIDIDILFYERLIFTAKNLEIPHPRLHLRNFTLMPLMELNKSYSHPKLKKSIEELAKNSTDSLKVSIFA
ncbi:MAG TPA: 2-amino-4-hydroxy-6-hydroxymethyldihydropteridine diphosphokinase [Chitinophagales bacterium]|nr:2-amino-4-hydroxy-6-hydroxymethyldihydropteridine diphosphokinase [Chitinophagales bacterium]